MAEPTVVRRSPAAAFAARFEAASAGGGLRLAEIPFLTQINLRVDPKSPAAERIGTAIGVPLPVEPGTVAGGGDLEVLWLGPDEWVLLAPDGAAPGLVARLTEAAGGEHVSVVDVSAQRTTLVVAGDRARDVLAHGCTLDLHPGSSARAAAPRPRWPGPESSWSPVRTASACWSARPSPDTSRNGCSTRRSNTSGPRPDTGAGTARPRRSLIAVAGPRSCRSGV